MFLRLSAILLVLSCLYGCAPNRLVVKHEASTVPGSTQMEIPQVTDAQLLGLEKLRGLWKDEASGQFALREVLQSYWHMKEDAEKQGWHLMLISGYRSFGSQRRIWNKSDKAYKKNGENNQAERVREIMKTVSVPGLSRHHWGTELDISEKSLRGQLLSIGPDTPRKVVGFYKWMETNAPKYGFCRVYQGKKGSIINEPWHWSYFPYSRVYHDQFVRITDFTGIMDAKVVGVKYLIRNFGEILDQALQSVDKGCFTWHGK